MAFAGRPVFDSCICSAKYGLTAIDGNAVLYLNSRSLINELLASLRSWRGLVEISKEHLLGVERYCTRPYNF